MSYAYQRSGHPILSWKRSVPVQSRAADAVSLGGLVLPAAGAPEPINSPYVSMGCSGCPRAGVGDVGATIAALPTGVKVGGALVLAYMLHKQLKKRR